jgi:hypothetical protein
LGPKRPEDVLDLALSRRWGKKNQSARTAASVDAEPPRRAKYSKKECRTMSKKLYAALLPVLAVVSFASMSGAAQAAPHWYKCEKVVAGTFLDVGCTEAGGSKTFELKRLPFNEEKTQVVTWGTLELTFSGITIKCKVIDAGNVWNTTEPAVGKDNIEVFVNYECSSASCTTSTIVAEGLPYETELIAGPPIRDRIKGITIKATCGALTETFTGELTPEVVNGTSQVKPTVAKFGAGSGELTGGAGGKATVAGSDRIVGFVNGEGIQAKNP